VRLAYVSTVMASLSLGAAVLLGMKVYQLERNLAPARAASRESRDAELALPDRVDVRAAPAVSIGDGEALADDRSQGAVRGAGSAVSRSKSPVCLEERITRLEERQRALQAEQGAPWTRHSRTFARNVEDLSRKLSLTPTQQGRIEEMVTRGRQRIEDVLKIPDETGTSPFERRAEARKKLEEAMKAPQPGGVLAFATDMMSYRERKIPGRNDTYGDEINRIRKETREEMTSVLDTKQQEAFGQTNVDGLLGEAGNVSFAYALNGTGEGGQEGMIVDMGAEVAPEEGTDGDPPAASGAGR